MYCMHLHRLAGETEPIGQHAVRLSSSEADRSIPCMYRLYVSLYVLPVLPAIPLSVLRPAAEAAPSSAHAPFSHPTCYCPPSLSAQAIPPAVEDPDLPVHCRSGNTVPVVVEQHTLVLHGDVGVSYCRGRSKVWAPRRRHTPLRTSCMLSRPNVGERARHRVVTHLCGLPAC